MFRFADGVKKWRNGLKNASDSFTPPGDAKSGDGDSATKLGGRPSARPAGRTPDADIDALTISMLHLSCD
jgi:hypothetical protein